MSAQDDQAQGAQLGLVVLTVACSILGLLPGFILGISLDAYGASAGLWPGDEDDASPVFLIGSLLAVLLVALFVYRMSARIAAASDSPPSVKPVLPVGVYLAVIAIEVAMILWL